MAHEYLSRMVPGYPSLFLPRDIMSSKYKLARFSCSPSHDVLVKRINRQKSENSKLSVQDNRIYGGDVNKSIQQPDLVLGQQSCRCCYRNEINDTGQSKLEVKPVEESTQEPHEIKSSKGKGKKSSTVSDVAKRSTSGKNSKSEEVEVNSDTSHKSTESEESGLFHDKVKAEIEDQIGRKDICKRLMSTDNIFKNKRFIGDVKRTSTNENKAQKIRLRTFASYRNYSYIEEEANQITHNDSADRSKRDDADKTNNTIRTNTNTQPNIWQKSPKNKNKKGSRFSTISSPKENNLSTLVKDIE